MKHISTLINEARNDGPFTIANTKAKVGQTTVGNLNT